MILVIIYGVQTWALTKKNIQRLKKTQHSMLPIILGTTRKDKDGIEKIAEKTKITDLRYKIEKLKYKFAEHLVREGDKKWASSC